MNMKDVFHEEVVSHARQKYSQIYEQEIELNEVFNTFVRNYKAAYEGRNTRRDQIIDSSLGLKTSSDDLCKYKVYSHHLITYVLKNSLQ